jgi:RNA polymerase sigma-70 factor (ECF subfamily)
MDGVSSSRAHPDAAGRAAPPEAAWGERAAALAQVVRAVIAAELRLPPRDAAVDELTQEVIRRALEGRDRLRPGAAPRPWIVGIARHVAADERRRQARLRPELTGAAGGDGRDAGDRPDPDPAPDELAQRAQRLGRLRVALARLPEGWRRALLLFHLEGLPYAQIARELGVPIGTVATWISRGRAELTSTLKEEEL